MQTYKDFSLSEVSQKLKVYRCNSQFKKVAQNFSVIETTNACEQKVHLSQLVTLGLNSINFFGFTAVYFLQVFLPLRDKAIYEM